MLQEILILTFITFLPLVELRLAIPVGILSTKINLHYFTVQGFNMNPFLVLIICILANIILGIIIYQFLHLFDKIIKKFPIINKKLDKSQKRMQPYVDKYGLLGVALFIALPLPGSGSYTGALGSYILGIRKRDFFIANTIGVTIAGILVTIITLGLNLFV